MTDKEESIITRFRISFQAMFGNDDKIVIMRETPASNGIDVELSIAQDLDPEEVNACISGRDMINPVINKARYNQFFLSRGVPVQSGFCTFEPYVKDQIVHVKLGTDGNPFDPGI